MIVITKLLGEIALLLIFIQLLGDGTTCGLNSLNDTSHILYSHESVPVSPAAELSHSKKDDFIDATLHKTCHTKCN